MSARVFICVEKPHQKKGKTLHEIRIPALNEPDGYEQLCAVDKFQCERQGKKPDEEFHPRILCNHAPEKIYMIKIKDEWAWETKNLQERLEKQQGALRDEYPETPIEAKSPEEIPRKFHESIWDFFKTIGFDPKRKNYTD